MERKNAIIAILALIALVSIIGWITSSVKYSHLKDNDKELAGYADTLDVCNNIETVDDETECADKLQSLSKLLDKYIESLKDIRLPDRSGNGTSTVTS